VARDSRERVVENMAIASALGFLAHIVATISLAVDSRAMDQERSVLAVNGSIALAGRANDACFDRVYGIQSEAGISYATVVTFRSPAGVALIGARFTPKGEVQELRFLGSCSSRLPASASGIISEFPGAAEAIDRAADYARRIASAAPAGRS
jgi:hypothetical protein